MEKKKKVNQVINFDFNSLYPGIMKTHNIRPDRPRIIRRMNKIKGIFSL